MLTTPPQGSCEPACPRAAERRTLPVRSDRPETWGRDRPRAAGLEPPARDWAPGSRKAAWPGDGDSLTVLQRGGVDLAGRRSRPRAVERLHHHPVLGKLLQVVQRVDLAVSRGLHLHNAVLAVAARAVLPVPDLVATDHPVLQLLLRGLRSEGCETERCDAGLRCPATRPGAGRLAGLPCRGRLSPGAFPRCFDVFSPHSSTWAHTGPQSSDKRALGGQRRGRRWLGSGTCSASAIPQLEQLNRREGGRREGKTPSLTALKMHEARL